MSLQIQLSRRKCDSCECILQAPIIYHPLFFFMNNRFFPQFKKHRRGLDGWVREPESFSFSSVEQKGRHVLSLTAIWRGLEAGGRAGTEKVHGKLWVANTVTPRKRGKEASSSRRSQWLMEDLKPWQWNMRHKQRLPRYYLEPEHLRWAGAYMQKEHSMSKVWQFSLSREGEALWGHMLHSSIILQLNFLGGVQSLSRVLYSD